MFKNYKPQVKGIWQGRIDDPDDIDSYRWHQWVKRIDLSDREIKPFSIAAPAFCFLGFCCDKGVEKNQGRVGTAKGPISIRKQMANLPVSFDRNLCLFDGGDLICTGESLESAQNQLAALVERICFLNLIPIVLGGGHEIALGHYTGLVNSISKLSPGEDPGLGIVNIDAHFDLRPYHNGGNSGTMFLQIADRCKANNREFSYYCLGIQKYGNTISLFKKAEELNVRYELAKDIVEATIPHIQSRLDTFLEKRKHIYLTICSDVFSSAFAPGVSASQPFGLHPEVVLRLVKRVLQSGKVIGVDIAEVSPRFDEDNRTAKLAATVIFAIVNTLSEIYLL